MKSIVLTATFATLLGLVIPTGVSAAEQNGKLHTTAVTTQGDDSITRPRNSQTMETVIAEFGEPDAKQDAIGDPPITRWEYAKYYVFFENDRVIHTVLKK